MQSVSFVFILFFLLFYLGVIAIMLLAMWRIYTKANKPGWACLVPIYNSYVLVEIAKKPAWYFGMLFVPIANIVFAIMIINGVAKAFGKTEGFTVGMIFLPFVFYPILGFGSAQYEDNRTEDRDLLDS